MKTLTNNAGEEMFFINERLRFISTLIDAHRLRQLKCASIADRENVGKEITVLLDKRRRLIHKGELILNEI